MIKTIKNLLIAVAFVASLGLASAHVAAANPANFGVSGGGSQSVGNTFSVSVSEDGDAVNTVTAKLTYDASKVQFLGMSCSGAWAGAIAESGGVTCYTSGGATVNATSVGTASFKALAPGASSITMASTSHIVSNGADIWSHVATGTSVNIVAAPTGGQGGSGGGTGSGGGSTGSGGGTSAQARAAATAASGAAVAASDAAGHQGSTASEGNANAGDPSSHKASAVGSTSDKNHKGGTSAGAEASTGRNYWLVGLAVVAIVAAAGYGFYLYRQRKHDEKKKALPVTVVATAVGAKLKSVAKRVTPKKNTKSAKKVTKKPAAKNSTKKTSKKPVSKKKK